MTVREITPDVDPAPWLAGAQFIDAGRAYLAVIMPFHRLIVRSVLGWVAACRPSCSRTSRSSDRTASIC
jgi:hypothetical protein